MNIHTARVVSAHARVSHVPPVASDLTNIPPLPPRPASEIAGSGHLPFEELPPLAELISAEATLDAAEGVDAVRRRLMFMRYLVRQRVYNEGFSTSELPAQYRWDTNADEISGN